MTYTPSSAIDFIEHFEAVTLNAENPFYYESSSNTINFGYGINLTAAENAALGGNTTPKDDLITWFNANGITADSTSIAGVSWSSFSKANLIANGNGTTIQDSLNADLTVGNYTAAADSITTSYVNTIVASALLANISNFNSLPETTQWALEAMYYNGSGTLGTLTYTAALAGDLVGIAEQLAFNANSSPSSSEPGVEDRYLGSALLALGIVPTFNDSNIVTDIDASGANTSDLVRFLSAVLQTNTLGSGGISADDYVSEWGTGPSASYGNIVSLLEQSIAAQGFYVTQSGDSYSSIAASLAIPGLTADDLAGTNAGAASDTLSAGTIISVPIYSAELNGTAVDPFTGTLTNDSGYYDFQNNILFVAPNFSSSTPATLTIGDGSGNTLETLPTNAISGISVTSGVLNIGLAAGRSEQDYFSYSLDGSSEQQNGYSGSNGTGSLLYQQTTNVSSTGAVSADVSGTGDSIGLDNASIALSDDTLATLRGTGNGVAMGNGSSVTDDTGGNTITGGTSNSITVSNSSDSTDSVSLGAGSQLTDNYADGSSMVEQFAPDSSVNTVVANYSGAGGSGTLNDITYNWTDDTSETFTYSGLASGDSEVVDTYSAPDDGGSLTQETTDYTAGNSQIELVDPESGVNSVYQQYSGLDGGGTLNSVTYNWTAGGSQVNSLTGLDSGVSELVQVYSDPNGGGSLTQETTDYTAGNSQIELYDPSDDLSTVFQEYSGLDGGGTVEKVTYNWDAGGSQIELFDPASGISTQFNNYTGANGTGTLTEQTNDNSDGTSQIEQFDPSSDYSSVTQDYSGLGGSGTLLTDTFDWSDGGSQKLFYPGSGIPSGSSEVVDNYSGADASGTLDNDIWDFDNGTSEYQAFTGLDSGVSQEISYYTGLNQSGTLTADITDYDAGNSQVAYFNPDSDVSSSTAEGILAQPVDLLQSER